MANPPLPLGQLALFVFMGAALPGCESDPVRPPLNMGPAEQGMLPPGWRNPQPTVPTPDAKTTQPKAKITSTADSGASTPDSGTTDTPDGGGTTDLRSGTSTSCGITDIPSTHPQYTAACCMVINQVMRTNGGKFAPNDELSRAEMAKHLMMMRYKGQVPMPIGRHRFTDVPLHHPYYRYVQKMKEEHITKGCDLIGPRFCPDGKATNGHAAVLCVRTKYPNGNFTLRSQQPHFTDVPSTHWAFPFIQKLHEDQANLNCAASKFCPDLPISRIRWARLLHTYFVR